MSKRLERLKNLVTLKKRYTLKNGVSGITLVALMVTTIVLLILAVVSISLVSNNGLLDKAKLAVDKYGQEEFKERIELAINSAKMRTLGILDKNVLAEELKNEFGENKFEIIGNDKRYVIHIKDKDVYYEISTTGTVRLCENYIGTIQYYCDKNEMKIGDYFEYTIENDPEEYILDEQLTGYAEEQKINISNYGGEWRILYNGNDENGIQIISGGNVLGTSKINLSGKEGYNNLVEILNKVSGKFINTNLAISSRSVGSNATDTEVSIGNTKLVKDSRPSNMKDDNVFNLVKDYKAEDENYKQDNEQIKKISNFNLKDIYYASREIRIGYHYGREADFMIRKYNNDWEEIAVVNGNGYYQKNNLALELRAVIKLKNDVKVYKIEENEKTIWKINN